MSVFGIHDGIGASAALIKNGDIIKAASEERFTHEKNDTGFPYYSISFLNRYVDDIKYIAIPWIGGSAFIRRFVPSYEENRRQLWRKQSEKPSIFKMQLNNILYKLIQNQRPKRFWYYLGKTAKIPLKKKINKLGFSDYKIFFVDHHLAHAASAYYTSGFDPCLIITLDGAGDGLSGSISIGRKGEIERIDSFPASSSFGLFFGAVTLALNMRFSEDEGKTMSLAPYSYPTQIKELEKIIKIKDGKPVSNLSIRYEHLLSEWIKNNILWNHTRESLAYAAQRYLEDCVKNFFKIYIDETGIRDIAVAGGIFSNVILNMKIREMPEVKKFYVFPHMGDGGLSAGAALYIENKITGIYSKKQIDNVYFGPEYSNNEIKKELLRNKGKIKFEEINDISGYTGELLNKGKIVLWFQDRMEFGPRALGNRSILAPADSIECKDNLNLIIKRRPYFQPFCPSILEEDAKKILEDYDDPCRFMTIGFMSKENIRDKIKAVAHIDNTTRPQILCRENEKFKKVIETVKKQSGLGIVLNTSLNKHRYPIVCSPKDALWTLLNTKAEYLCIQNYFVTKK